MEFKSFPHPTRPSSYANLTSFKYATAITQHSEPVGHHMSEPSTSTDSYQQQRRSDEDELFCELTRILVECLEIVDDVPKCLLLRKVFLELEKESEMENFIVEKLKHSQVKAISDFLERYQERFTNQVDEDEVKYVSRGFKQDLMELEYSHRLERFKVKTINIEGGVIKK